MINNHFAHSNLHNKLNDQITHQKFSFQYRSVSTFCASTAIMASVSVGLTLAVLLCAGPVLCLICFEKKLYSAVSTAVDCDNGYCRLLRSNGGTNQDCMLGFSHLKIGCRVNLSNNDSVLCFCRDDYCNSARNLSNSKDLTMAFFPETQCIEYRNDGTIGSCISTICYVGKHDNGMIYGGCFHGAGVWMTKYEALFQIWPYGHRLQDVMSMGASGHSLHIGFGDGSM